MSHLWVLPSLFKQKEELNKERLQLLTGMLRPSCTSRQPTGSIYEHQWSTKRCAEWLTQEVNLPEHVPAFTRATVCGAELLRLDEARLKALGVDAIDSEIILARVQFLKRQVEKSRGNGQWRIASYEAS